MMYELRRARGFGPAFSRGAPVRLIHFYSVFTVFCEKERRSTRVLQFNTPPHAPRWRQRREVHNWADAGAHNWP